MTEKDTLEWARPDEDPRQRARRILQLSEREFEVLELLFEGDTYDEIGTKLGITRPTVRKYIARIQAKIDADRPGRIVTLTLKRLHPTFKV